MEGYVLKIQNKGYEIFFEPQPSLKIQPLKLRCSVCGHIIKYKRGRVLNPKKKIVLKWLNKFQCPFCGKKRFFII